MEPCGSEAGAIISGSPSRNCHSAPVGSPESHSRNSATVMRCEGTFNAVDMQERCALVWLTASDDGGRRRNRGDFEPGRVASSATEPRSRNSWPNLISGDERTD